VVYIAFNNPCIEAWALLHFIPPDSVPGNVAACHTLLHNYMSSYDHNNSGHLVLDINLMEGTSALGYNAALAGAQCWATTAAGAPIYESSKYAGIAELVKSIK
jgi:sorbitol-specific phosphotransferase system component IIC